MKTILLITTLFLVGGWISVTDEQENDKIWDQANGYYQLEQYDKALPLFEEAIEGYIADNDKAMITTTQTCLAFTHYNLGILAKATNIANQINWKYKIEDVKWNRSTSDLLGLLGKDEMQIKYLKRA